MVFLVPLYQNTEGSPRVLRTEYTGYEDVIMEELKKWQWQEEGTAASHDSVCSNEPSTAGH